MKNGLFVLSICVSLFMPGSILAQIKTAPKSLAQLELTMEVATTSEDGYPSAIRITVKNIGAVPVDMPLPEGSCVVEGGGVQVRSAWHSTDGLTGSGSGGSCGTDHFPTLQWRMQNEWIRLRPGEFVSLTKNVRRDFRDRKPGTVEIWAEYQPPEVKPAELAALEQVGYIIPTEKIETEHRSFVIR